MRRLRRIVAFCLYLPLDGGTFFPSFLSKRRTALDKTRLPMLSLSLR